MQESVNTKLLESNKKSESAFESTNPLKNTTNTQGMKASLGQNPMECTEELRVPKSLAAMIVDMKMESDRKTN